MLKFEFHTAAKVQYEWAYIQPQWITKVSMTNEHTTHHTHKIGVNTHTHLHDSVAEIISWRDAEKRVNLNRQQKDNLTTTAYHIQQLTSHREL